jgi:hypothetical protein
MQPFLLQLAAIDLLDNDETRPVLTQPLCNEEAKTLPPC